MEGTQLYNLRQAPRKVLTLQTVYPLVSYCYPYPYSETPRKFIGKSCIYTLRSLARYLHVSEHHTQRAAHTNPSKSDATCPRNRCPTPSQKRYLTRYKQPHYCPCEISSRFETSQPSL